MMRFYHRMPLDNPLWHYISAVYSHPEIETLCLEMQAQGLQVNSVLCCIWLAHEHKRYDPELFETAQQSWRQGFLLPLRQMRYALRQEKHRQAALSACYESVKHAELAMEQIDIALLWQSAAQISQRAQSVSVAELARANLESYMVSEKLSNLDICHYCCRSLIDRLC